MKKIIISAIVAGLLAYLLALMVRMAGVHEVFGSIRGTRRYI